jgi:hypothetical protein
MCHAESGSQALIFRSYHPPHFNEKAMNKEKSTTIKALMSNDNKKAAKTLLKDIIICKERKINSKSKVKIAV